MKLLSFKEYSENKPAEPLQEGANDRVLLTIDCSKLRGVIVGDEMCINGKAVVNGRTIILNTTDKLYRKSNEAYDAVMEAFSGKEFDAEEVFEELALIDLLESEDYELYAHDLGHAVVAECLHPGVVSVFNVTEAGVLELTRTRNPDNIQYESDIA